MRLFWLLTFSFISTSCTLKTFSVPLAPATDNRAVIFDIDGTLTPTVSSIFSVRVDAANAVNFYASQGYKIVYLSARVRLLQSSIPDWLKENNFPEGSIQVPQSSEDGADHAAFKTRVLKEFQAAGWQIVAAYGDSSTDFEAYNSVGIYQEHIFALKRSGKKTCQPGIWRQCISSWTEHLSTIEDIVPTSISSM